MSSPTGSSQWLANPGGDFYNGVATTSLRLDSASSQFLSQTLGTTDRQKFTFSVWIKRTKLGTVQNIFSGGDNSSNNDYWFGFTAADILQFQNITGSAYNIQVTTARKFRDTSSWYNFVLSVDSTIEDSGTVIDRVRLYVNGVRETLTVGHQLQNDELASVNLSGSHKIGILSYATSQYLDGYLSDVNFVDGTSLEPSAFGELKNGVWIPINPSPTYGTNGYRLQFTSTAHDAPASNGSADTDNIGADSSGENNHFTADDAIGTHDCAMPDSPENNFATWNQNYRIFGDTGFLATTNGALFTNAGDVNNDRYWAMSTIAVNEVLRNSDGAGVYMEIRSPSVGGDNGYLGLYGRQGFDQKAGSAKVRSDNTDTLLHFHLISPNGRTLLEAGESSSAALAGLNGAPTDNAVIGFAVKSDGKFFISVDGTFSTNADGNTQNPVTGANPFGTIDTDIDFFLHAGNISVFQANFGQDSTFGGNETATTNADANGIGAFHTAPPTGYLALCTSNMAEPTIGPNSTSQADDYFETVLYEGDGSTQDIAVNFKPDWTWIKNRDAADSHQLFDSNRGVTKVLQSDTTTAEVANDDTLTAFISTGFSLGDDVAVNTNNESYVAWNWKANGGTATATISESGDNPAASVQANPTAGFSIITYTGTGDAGTIAHGLGVVPKWIIIKNRAQADAWAVYHGENTAAPATDYLVLNTTAATADAATYWADTAPTSSVFTVHDAHNVNADGETYVAYVFAEVKGYSRMGSYIGNGAANGIFVYLGFRPAFVMMKRIDSTGSWFMLDNTRDVDNEVLQDLIADGSGDETSNSNFLDFLSNGFKLRTTGTAVNAAAGTYIYMAFAEAPFKYSNAR